MSKLRSVKDPELSEHDLALIHALQIAPRVSWSDAAEVLGSTPTRLASSWERLRRDGLAWVTAHPAAQPGSLVVAFVEIDCVPGSRHAVVRSLCSDQRVATVEQAARGRDLLLTVMAPDLARLTSFVLEDLSDAPGVARTRTFLATAVHRQASDWRLDALDRTQREALEGLARPPWQQAGITPPSNAWPLIEALCRDGRATAAELARHSRRNPATVRRQLPRLLASRVLSFRCDIAQEQTQWPVSCTFFGRIPATEQDRTAAALATLPELRLCVSTTGESNLMFTVWVRSLERLLDLEKVLGERLPWLQVMDTAVNLRTPKRMGWVLDEHGRAREVVPMAALSRL